MQYNTEVFKANSNRGYEIRLFCKLGVYCTIIYSTTLLPLFNAGILDELLISSPQFFHKLIHGMKWDKNELGCRRRCSGFNGLLNSKAALLCVAFFLQKKYREHQDDDVSEIWDLLAINSPRMPLWRRWKTIHYTHFGQIVSGVQLETIVRLLLAIFP